MSNYRYILFDLDGTIIDSSEGITRSIMHALAHFDITVDDPASLRRFIGPPMVEVFRERYGFSEEQCKVAMIKYREMFTSRGIHENKLFPGMRELLTDLKSQGRELFVATSKPEPFARMILGTLGLADKFVFIGGADFDGNRCNKTDVVRYVLQTRGITDLSRAVLVGDSKYDIQAARAIGLDAIGVLYGFGDRAEMEAAGMARIAADTTELRAMLGIA